MKRQLQRLFILTVIFTITGIGALYVTYKGSNNASYNTDDVSVAFTDTSSIQSIIVHQKKGQLQLDKNLKNWFVNKRFLARRQLTSLLLFGLQHLEVKRPISSGKDKIMKELTTQGLLIEVQAEQSARSFYIMSNPNDVNSSYFLEKNSSSPLIVQVPGVKGELSNLLQLEENDWRARDIFTSTYRSLRSIEVVYNDKKQQGFSIEYADGAFRLQDGISVDTFKLKKYIALFGMLGGERFLTGSPLGGMPSATIKVQDIDSTKSDRLDIYFSRQQLIGRIESTGDIMLLNPEIFKYVLIDRSFFSKKN